MRFFLFLFLTMQAAFAQVIATDARLTGDKERTRLIIDLSKSVEFKSFPLADPNRLIIDLEEVSFNLPPDAGATGRGLISAYRFGQFAPGKSRIVIDLADTAKIDKAFVMERVENQPARLVIDLVKTDKITFAKGIKEQTPTLRERVISQPDQTRPLVVIDPGHGGIDAGAVASIGTTEKSLVLAFGLKLKEKLEVDGRVRVLMTRNDDSFIPLPERVRIAREANAALFISIHADSLPGDGEAARGATIYTLSETASDVDAARLAEKENKSDAIAGLDLKDEPTVVSDILIDFTRRETQAFSLQFSRNLANYMKSATRLHRLPHRSAGFRVLRAHDVPSVLVELGYITSAQDLSMLTSEEWRNRTTDAMSKAVLEFFVKTRELKP
jgi:N-acetylmuramoyl-L-alanine amidase